MRPAILSLLALFPLFSQQVAGPPPEGDAAIRVDVRQVLVPVIVTDNKGHHVSGLHASDFRILEDGVPQEIDAFSTDTAASVDDVSALGTNPAPRTGPRRTYVICIDTLHSSPASAVRIREALENLFHDEKAGDAQYVLIGIGRQLQVLQTATTNPLSVLIKLRAAGFQSVMGGSDASAMTAELNNLKIHMQEFCKRCACGVRSNQRGCDSEVDTLKQSVDAEAANWEGLNNGVAAQFKSVVDELAKIPTGRTLILISEGFDLNPKREFYEVVRSWLPGSPQFRLPDAKDLEPALHDALKTAAERNVVIYGIDARGGYAPTLVSSGIDAGTSGAGVESQSVIRNTGRNSGSEIMRNTPLQTAPGQSFGAFEALDSATMKQLAQSTGGTYSHESRDLLKQFRGALADGREYYVLSYVPKNRAEDGGFRSITVQVTGKNQTARAKAGYWAARSDQ